jgi:hypothetical protein
MQNQACIDRNLRLPSGNLTQSGTKHAIADIPFREPEELRAYLPHVARKRASKWYSMGKARID